MARKFLDVNKKIIYAIFLLDGNEEAIDRELDNLLEEKGTEVKKRKTKAEKEKEKIVAEAKATPTRRVKRKLFKNR